MSQYNEDNTLQSGSYQGYHRSHHQSHANDEKQDEKIEVAIQGHKNESSSSLKDKAPITVFHGSIRVTFSFLV